MKYFGLVLSLLAVTCQGAPINEYQQPDSEDVAFARNLLQNNGKANNILSSEECNPEKVSLTFTLYTREAPHGQVIDPANNETLKNSSYNIKFNTSIVLNEWTPLDNGSFAEDFASAFLRNKKQRSNVVVVNYGSVGNCDFESFLNLQPAIGQQVAEFLRFAMRYGSTPSKFQLIGVGMGAQIAGYAAREIHPRKVGRLTALNPTFIGYFERNSQLKPKDADYMDVIHTAQRRFGEADKLGNARFYPNGGARQTIATPNQNEMNASLNSHYASVFYYLQSILDPTYFKARLCKDWLHYTTNQCGEPEVYNYMGDQPDIKAYGKFYLQTVSSSTPFGEREVDVKYFDLRRYMDVTFRGVKKIESADVAVAQQAYENKKNQANTEEDVAYLVSQYGSKIR